MAKPRKGDASLRRTKTILEDKGWIQRAYVDQKTGAVCLSEACYLASSWEDRDTVTMRIVEAIRKESDLHWTYISGWNDEEGRTLEEVFALIDRTIEEG